jgi:hypothetical protein
MPLRDSGGRIWSLQWISPTHKGLEKDARLSGCFHLIDPKGELGEARDILVVEGYATGASVHQATGRPVVVAVNAANLAAVGTALRQAYPQRPIVFLGDDDRHLPPKLPNAGREKAEQAAREVGGHAVFPRFTATERGPDFTDWNDLHRARGLTVVKRQVEAELARVKRREHSARCRRAPGGSGRRRSSYPGELSGGCMPGCSRARATVTLGTGSSGRCFQGVTTGILDAAQVRIHSFSDDHIPVVQMSLTPRSEASASTSAR